MCGRQAVYFTDHGPLQRRDRRARDAGQYEEGAVHRHGAAAGADLSEPERSGVPLRSRESIHQRSFSRRAVSLRHDTEPQRHRTLAKADLLILDELSYLSFNRHQSELLFKVISDRSEKSSTIVTTNLPFSNWTDLFENTTMVAALIDRLTFRSHVLDMNGDSYRLKATMQNKA